MPATLRKSSHTLSEFLELCAGEQTDIAIVLDSNLNYLAANAVACVHLDVELSALIGNSITDLFPHIIASDNHRNILSALEGEALTGMLHIHGLFYQTQYVPVISDNQVIAVYVRSARVRNLVLTELQ